MGRQRQPLILQRTANVLSNFESRLIINEVERSIPPELLLQAGLLHPLDPSYLTSHFGASHTTLDETNIVGLSVAALKRLSICSGSWVLVRHALTKVGRPAKVVALDPPFSVTKDSTSHEDSTYEDKENKFCFLPSTALQPTKTPNLRGDVAYLSTILAFNLGLHITWLHQWLACQCTDKPAASEEQNSCLELSLLENSQVIVCSLWKLLRPPSGYVKTIGEGKESFDQSPFKFAFHVRIGLVKVPDSGFPESYPEELQGSSDVDSALQEYFKCNRALARGDIFAVWVGDERKHHSLFDERSKERKVFFKVIAMEPEMEPFLLVNCNHSALVLGESVPSRLPPLVVADDTRRRPLTWMMPTINELTRVLAPALSTAPSLPLKSAVLLTGPAGCGKRTVVEFAAEAVGMHVVEYNCHELLGSSDGKTVAALSQAFEVARRYAPAILLLRRFGALGKAPNPGSVSDGGGAASRVISVLQDFIFQNSKLTTNDVDGMPLKKANLGPEHFRLSYEDHIPGLVLVVAAAESTEGMPRLLRGCFTHEFRLQPPDEQQRSELLHEYLHLSNRCGDALLQERSIGKECQLETVSKSIASQCSGAVLRDLKAIVADAGTFMLTNCNKKEHTQDCEVQGDVDDDCSQETMETDFIEKAFERFKSRMATELGAPKVPNVKWEDVGGLEDVKKAILDTVQLPLVHRDLFALGLRQRSGVLLYGPPGTGKTLLAKAVATECSLKFLSVKGPELINMYIGESERNVRDIFEKARTARPCVIFFDELDALAPARGASGDSGGVMDRVVSQMLAEIDGLNEGQQDLFIIGASNRPDLIDPALLRPGRFDKLLYVGISSDISYRQRVLEALTRKFQLDKDVHLEDVAQICPANFTGADLYALCADAWMVAVKRQVSMLETNQGAKIVVRHEDFTEALRQLTPSLSPIELSRYERLRAQFEGQSATPSTAAIVERDTSINGLD